MESGVTLDVLLSDTFLQKHTQFGDLGGFEAALEAAGVDVFALARPDALNADAVNAVVAAHSGFSSLKEMLYAAAAEHFVAKMGAQNGD